jgi:Ca2+-binding RTX toxin-like protein
MNGRLRLAIGGLGALAVLAFASAALAHSVVRIVGSMHDDTITGTPGPDFILARAGNDTVNAGDGNDRVHGNRGDDTVNGEGGNDRVWGGVGNDKVTGGDGNDVLRGRPGDDSLDGGAGNDRTWPGGGTDTQYGGEGDDVLHALARDHKVDTLDCGPGNDTAVLNADETSDTTVNCETIRKVTITNAEAERQENGYARLAQEGTTRGGLTAPAPVRSFGGHSFCGFVPINTPRCFAAE